MGVARLSTKDPFGQLPVSMTMLLSLVWGRKEKKLDLAMETSKVWRVCLAPGRANLVSEIGTQVPSGSLKEVMVTYLTAKHTTFCWDVT